MGDELGGLQRSLVRGWWPGSEGPLTLFGSHRRDFRFPRSYFGDRRIWGEVGGRSSLRFGAIG